MKRRFMKMLSLALTAALFASCTPSAPLDDEDETSEEPEPEIIASEHIAAADGGYVIYSPDKSLNFTFGTGDTLFYCVDRKTENGSVSWIQPSLLGVTVGSTDYGKNASAVSYDVDYIREDRALLGNQSVVKCRCIQATFNMRKDDAEFKIQVRVYNDGVAFRYILPVSGAGARVTDSTTYSLRSDVSKLWYSVYTGALGTRDYEAIPEEHEPSETQTKPIYMPLLAMVGDNAGYISIMEGDMNESYPGTTLSAKGDGVFATSYMSTPQFKYDEPITTAWKMINIAGDLNGIVNNYNLYTLAPIADEDLYGDSTWITPGRSTWSWVAEGVLGELGWGGIPTVSMMERYISVATKLGFEYNIIDAGWPAWDDYKNGLAHLGTLGNDNNVKQVLWGGITSGTDGFNKMPTREKVDEFLDLLEETHMSGAKIDFWWDESDTETTALQQYILKEAAKRNMVIDFHGCNKPSGFNITYPNELSREGIHGGEYYQMPSADKVDYSRLITGQLFTRYLAGHADWTPGTYNAMEIASALCMDSPLMVYASKPEDILQSPAVEMIKSMPSTWDRTVVLSDSVVGKYAVYAKEKGKVWFAGAVASDTVNGARINLAEFLPDGEYTAEVWYDNGDKMENKTLTVTNADIIEIGDLTAGEGFIARFSKLTTRQYGGEIKGTVTVTAPAGATVKYTTDGTDPKTSDTAVTYKDGITLSESCRLTVAITAGTGKGTKMSYQFNKVD